MKTQIDVNVDRLFSKIKRYFGSPESALTEAVQNAYRASLPVRSGDKVPQIHLLVDGTTVRITDEGRGIADPLAMLSLAESEWEDDVEHDQDPAGLGVCGILAFCESATWSSKFGELTIESEKFFSDPEYRASVPALVKRAEPGFTVGVNGDCPPVGRSVGTELIMHQFTGALTKDKANALFSYYRCVDIYWNGRAVSRAELAPKVGTIAGKESRVHSNLKEESRYDFNGKHGQIEVIWHGHKIVASDFSPSSIELPVGPIDATTLIDMRPTLIYDLVRGGLAVTIDVRDENVVTPKLPDRTSLCMDDRTIAFLEEAWAIAVHEYHAKLSLRLLTPPKTIADFKLLRANPAGVTGWDRARAVWSPYKIQPTCRLRDDEPCGYSRCHKSHAIVIPSSEGRTYAKDEVLVLVGNEVEFGKVYDEPHGLLFDGGESDPLADISVYPGSAHFRLIIDLGVEAVSPAADKPLVVSAKPTYYLVPSEVFERQQSAEDLREAYATFKLDVKDECDVLLCGTYIDNSNLSDDFLYVTETGNVDDAISVLSEVFDSHIEDHYQDEPEGKDEAYADFRVMWEQQRAVWAGKIHLSVHLSDLAGSLPGRPNTFQVNVADKTVTLPDGTVHNVTW